MNKSIDQMNTLSDMTRFPWTVHLGASLNIVFSIWLTHKVFQFANGSFLYFLPFVVTLILLNLIPVYLLRQRDSKLTKFSKLGEMDFFRDQHRFSSWVYAIASGNMLFWTVFAWWVFTISEAQIFLLAAQGISFVITFVPLWRRLLR